MFWDYLTFSNTKNDQNSKLDYLYKAYKIHMALIWDVYRLCDWVRRIRKRTLITTKVPIFWEGQKIIFDITQIFCGLLRKPQLWVCTCSDQTVFYWCKLRQTLYRSGQCHWYWSLTVWTLGIADLGMQTGNCKYKRRPQHSDWGHF